MAAPRIDLDRARKTPLAVQIYGAIREACDAAIWEDDLPPPRATLLEAVRGCDGVLTLLTDKVDDEFLDAAGPQLKVVSNYAVGFDNVDVAACTARGVAVGNTPLPAPTWPRLESPQHAIVLSASSAHVCRAPAPIAIAFVIGWPSQWPSSAWHVPFMHA